MRFSSSDESREWASAMLRELDFVDSDWEALLWALGSTSCDFHAFRAAGLWVWLGKSIWI